MKHVNCDQGHRRSTFALCRGFALVFALASSAPLLAGDWYVDAQHGSDASSGTSPADAWLTITHALAVTPAPPAGGTQVIHVAPGTYDAALGESFPILLRDAFQIVGDQGRDVTTIDANYEDVSVMQAAFDGAVGNPLGPSTLVRGLTLSNGTNGVDLACSNGPMHLTLEEFRFWYMTSAGLRSISDCASGCGQVLATCSHGELNGCGVGVEFQSLGQIPGGAPPAMSLTDCYIVQSSFHGVFLYDTGGGANLTLLRTNFTANGGESVWALQSNTQVPGDVTRVSITDSLIHDNAIDAVKAEVAAASATPSTLLVDIVRCTLVNNFIGVDMVQATGSMATLQVTLAGTIVYHNFDDIALNPVQPPLMLVSHCDIGDGDFAGSNGNISDDPMFDATGDYRLRWGSPCIDTGAAVGSPGELDLAGYARPIDGNLDTLERDDIGAYEFAPLFHTGTGQIGTPLAFELWGPQDNATTIYYTRQGLIAPQATPFGELDLSPGAMHVYRWTTVGSGPPHVISRMLPQNPSLVGSTFSFQALTDCAAAPQGQAYTNPVQITLTP